MALNWVNINHITQQRFIPTLVDQIYRSNPTFMALYSKGRIEIRGGQDIREPVLFGKFPLTWVQFYDEITVTPREFVKSLVLDWAMAVIPGTVSEMEIHINGGETRILDIVAITLDNMRLSMQDQLAAHLYDTSATPPPKSMHRLIDAISDTTVYGGIDPSVDTWWKSVVINASNAEPTFALLNDAILQTSHGNTSPDLVITTKKIWNKLWVNAQDKQRFPEGDDVLVGYEMIRLGRARVVYDDFCPPGRIFGLNTDFIKLIVHPDANFRFTGWRDSPNQLSKQGFLVFMGNLLVNGRRYHFRIDNVSES